jgi:tetratricopeptide (TPR) repeat protein
MFEIASLPADTTDLVSSAVIYPEASLFTRVLLQTALKNPAGLRPDWVAQMQALLANVLMNDYLNRWNPNTGDLLGDAKKAVNEAGNSALALHAQGLIARAEGNYAGARDAFQRAVDADPSFARTQGQLGNQMVLSGENRQQARRQIRAVINQNPHHPASGYFYWALGRAFFLDEKWRDAITWLTKSVAALPTVSYNRAYLAAAQQHDQKPEAAKETLQQFINNPRFGNPKRGKQKVEQIIPLAAMADPNTDPVGAARQYLRNGLLAAVANLP